MDKANCSRECAQLFLANMDKANCIGETALYIYKAYCSREAVICSWTRWTRPTASGRLPS